MRKTSATENIYYFTKICVERNCKYVLTGQRSENERQIIYYCYDNEIKEFVISLFGSLCSHGLFITDNAR